ncbi:MAG TPA: hypothetical protein VHJ78_02245 [Actinomycetota bacterium]|nr:hypothetical protein [Actinomycetota bacterium]
MLDSFTAETFRPLVGQTFVLRAGGERLELQLAEVNLLGSAARVSESSRNPFSLLFHGPVEPVWGQRTYPVEIPALGEFDLFLVPIGPDGGAMRYEAIFT